LGIIHLRSTLKLTKLKKIKKITNKKALKKLIKLVKRKIAYKMLIIQNLDVLTLELGMKVEFPNF
jgi:hypothetical protein